MALLFLFSRNPKRCMYHYGKRCFLGLVVSVSVIVVLSQIYLKPQIRTPTPMKRIYAKENSLPKKINHKSDNIPQSMLSHGKNRTAEYLLDPLQELEKQINRKSDKIPQSMSSHGKNRTAEYLLDPLQELEKLFENQLDVKKTKIAILGTKTIFSLGDIVKLRITLHKKDGSPRLTGGDRLRVRLFEARLNASASGRVVDHGNGSHTAVVKCLWTGSPTLHVYLSSMAEIEKFIQLYKANIPAVKITYAVYKNGETGACHPLRKWLTESRDICNMTSRNGGMSWFCEGPKSGKQFCDAFQYYTSERKDNDVFKRVFKLRKERAMDPVQITVKDKTNFVKPSTLPCSLSNRTKLWTEPSPIGYFYMNNWELLHCTPPPSGQITGCLRHKHFVMYGDSTVRQWFVEINRRFECTLVTEEWTQPKWRLDSRIYCGQNNLTVDLIFHAQPGNFDRKKVVYESVSRHMLNFYKRTDIIFLISVHKHFIAYQPSLYRVRIQHIVRSVVKILNGNPNSKILVKGGHTAWGIFSYQSYIFRNIVTQEFAGVHDRVIYLDNEDITMAKLVIEGHPPADIVSVMVDHMLGYVCN